MTCFHYTLVITDYYHVFGRTAVCTLSSPRVYHFLHHCVAGAGYCCGRNFMKQQKCTKLWMWRYFHILATLENDIFFRIKSVILNSFLITVFKIEKPKAIWPINFRSYTQFQLNFPAIISAMHPKSEWNDHIKIFINIWRVRNCTDDGARPRAAPLRRRRQSTRRWRRQGRPPLASEPRPGPGPVRNKSLSPNLASSAATRH